MKSRLSKEPYFMAWHKSLIFHRRPADELVTPQDPSPCDLLGMNHPKRKNLPNIRKVNDFLHKIQINRHNFAGKKASPSNR